MTCGTPAHTCGKDNYNLGAPPWPGGPKEVCMQTPPFLNQIRRASPGVCPCPAPGRSETSTKQNNGLSRYCLLPRELSTAREPENKIAIERNIISRGVRRKIGGNPQFSRRNSPGNPTQTLFLQFLLHYILENYTREPLITQGGGIPSHILHKIPP